MAKIKTKQGLHDWVLSQLGAPTINIEVTEEQIFEIIDAAVQKFTEYAYGTLEGTVVVQIDGSGEYPMPEGVTNLIEVSKGATSNLTNFSSNFGAGYVPDMWSNQFFSNSLTGDIIPSIVAISNTKAVLDKYFGNSLSYNFNPYKNILYVQENFSGPVCIHYQYEYVADDVDGIYNHEWIREYSKAKVKELWGTVTGKFDQALVGGARINYDRILQEAETAIQKLDEELLNKWSDPAPIMVG